MVTSQDFKMITVLGPTATGKTKLAAAICYLQDGEIISADSRQVYRGMDIGTGKDLEDYTVNDRNIPSHLIDIANPGEEYNVFSFQEDFKKAYADIVERGKLPVMCGGTGMYLDAVLKGYNLVKVPENAELRERLSTWTDELLQEELLRLQPNQHNTTDLNDRGRLIRAIEIGTYNLVHQNEIHDFPKINSINFGIAFDRAVIRNRITSRLKDRLQNGMIEEVETLINQGVHPDKLRFYGLEYRYVTDYITGETDYETMFQLLNTAIHQFAKRQSTWYRRMEKKGTKIHWLDGNISHEERLSQANKIIIQERG